MLEYAIWASHVDSWSKAEDLGHSLIAQFKVKSRLLNVLRLIRLCVQIGSGQHDSIRLIVEDFDELPLLELDDSILEEELVLLQDHEILHKE